MGARTVLVFSGGDPLTAAELACLPEDVVAVVAADSGVERSHECGRTVTLAVGDFDSAAAVALARAEESGAALRRSSTVKDETDLELALLAALEFQPDKVVVAALGGGRADHRLASLHVCTHESLAAVDVDLVIDDTLVSVVRSSRTITGHVGDLVSLVPIGGSAEGVRTSGLRYPLDGETLHVHRSRGVSNVLDGPMAVISASGGVLLAMQPLNQEAGPI